MCGKYLKARQLAKEMEEKAKETAELKEKANDKLEDVEILLDISKDNGVAVEDIEEKLEGAKEKLDDKDFKDAIELFEECLKDLREANIENIDQEMEGVKNFYSSPSFDKRVSSLEEKLEEPKELVKDDQLEEAYEKLEEVKEETQEGVKDTLESMISDTGSFKDMVKGQGLDTEDIEKSLSKAQVAFEEEDYGEALEQTQDAQKKAEDKISDVLPEIISELNEKKQSLKEEGADTADIDQALERAEELQSEGDIKAGISEIEEAQQQIHTIFEQIVQSKYKKLKSDIDEAKDIDAETKSVELVADNIEDALDKNDLEKANELLDKGLDKVEDVKFEKVLTTIAESRKDFIKAKELGADIEEPMNLLNSARDSLKQGDYREALKWARVGREKVEELVKEHESAKQKIEKKKKEIEEFSDILDMEFSEAQEIVDEAEKKLEERDFDKAVELAEKADDKIDDAAYGRMMDIIEEFEDTLETARDLQIDIEDYSTKLEESRNQTEASDYINAAGTAINNKDELQDKIEGEIKDKINAIRDKMMDVSDLEEDIEDEVEDLLSQGKKDLSKGRHTDSYGKIVEAEELLEGSQIERAREHLSEAFELLDLVEDLGIEDVDLEDLRSILKEAEDELESDYMRVIEKTGNVINTLNNNLKDEADSLFSDAKMEVVQAKKSGCDITDLRNELINCKKNIKKNNFATSVRLAHEVKEEAVNRRTNRKDAYEVISNTASDITEAKKEGRVEDISSAKDLLLQAKEEFKSKNYSEAKTLAEDASEQVKGLQRVTDYRRQKESLEDKLNKTKDTALSYVDIEDIEDEMRFAEEQADDDDYEEAVETLKEAEATLLEMLEETYREELGNTKDMVNSAKEIGVNTTEYEQTIEKLESQMDEGNYWEGFEKIEQYQKEIKKLREQSKQAENEVKDAQQMMEEAKQIGAKLDTPQEILNRAEEALEEAKYIDAIDKAKLVKKRIKDAKGKRIDKILDTFKDTIEEVRSEGVDTALADNLMTKAEKAKEKGEYKEAINLAMQSEGELERIKLQQRIAAKSISTAEEKLKESEEKNLPLDEVEELLDEARNSYQGGFYVKAFDNAFEVGEKLTNYLRAFNESQELLDDLKLVSEELDSIREEEDIDIETKKIRDKKEAAEEEFKKERYENTYNLCQEAEKILLDEELKIERAIDKTREEIEGIDREKVKSDVEEAEKRLNRAKTVMDIGRPFKAIKLICQAKEISGLKKREEYNELIQKVEGLVENAKKFGASVGNIEEMVEKARAAEEGGKTIEAYEQAKKAHEKVEEALEPYSPRLELDIDAMVQIDEWNTVTAELMNKGNGVAKSPHLDIEGGEIEEVDLPNMLKSGDDLTKEIDIKPMGRNATVKFSGIRIFDKKEIVVEQGLRIKGWFEIKGAEGGENCDICGGTLSEGEGMYKCSCGNVYHESCGIDEKKCPECGTQFIKEGDKKEKEEGKKKSRRLSLDI